MRIIEDLAQLAEYQGVALTLGNFDGLHLGHQAIIKKVAERALELKNQSVVFTFQEHPLKFLTGGNPPLLTTLEEKYSLLEGMGIDLAICIPFSRQIASTYARQFIEDIIYPRLKPAWIVVGHDYAFGKDRVGDIDLLKILGREYGFQAEEIEAVKVAGMTVSSTLIRKKIAEGQMQEAAQLLGRPYSLQSQVIAGQRKGKALAYRTANLASVSKILPAMGVYAVNVQLGDKTYQGVANIGHQPTYGKYELQLEVHLLDVNADLYGQTLRVFFIAKLRDEQKFPDELALNQQITEDICRARQMLGVLSGVTT